MYFKLLYLSLVLLITSVAQLNAEIFSIKLNWQQGDVYRYALTESHIVFKDKLPILNNIQKNEISVEFYRISNDYNKLRWRYTKIQFDSSRASDYLYKSLYNLSKILVYDIITDKHGDYQYIINWETIRDLGTVFIDSVISRLPEHYEGKDIESAKQALNAIKAQYTSHDGIELALMQNIQIFLQAFSYNYDNTGPIEQEAIMKNPVSNESVSGKLIRIGIIDKDKKTLAVDIKQLVRDTVNAQGFERPQPLELLFKTSVDIDTTNGTVKDLSYSRQVIMGKTEDIKSVFFRRIH
jgi:hypothetical protein